MPRVRLTEGFVARAQHNASNKEGRDRTAYWCGQEPGFGLIITVGGHRSFVFQWRNGTRQCRLNLDGRFARLQEQQRKNGNGSEASRKKLLSPLASARREATLVRAAIAQGRDPLEEVRTARESGQNTLQSVIEVYLHREAVKLRRHSARRRLFERYVLGLPGKYMATETTAQIARMRLGAKPIDQITRAHITGLLDVIEEQCGAVQADAVLAGLSRLFNWHAPRVADFRSPLVRGMNRAAPMKARARKRILSDDEIRALWLATEVTPGLFGIFARTLLLTGARRSEVARMLRSEVVESNWTIPAERTKTAEARTLPLPPVVMNLLEGLPAIDGTDFFFSNDGRRALGGFSQPKKKLDAAMLTELRKNDTRAELPHWQLHDLRRSSRSLMSRAGIQPRTAEQVLGHTIQGVEGTYDRHRYLKEKRAALEALAALVMQIVRPPMLGKE